MPPIAVHPDALTGLVATGFAFGAIFATFGALITFGAAIGFLMTAGRALEMEPVVTGSTNGCLRTIRGAVLIGGACTTGRRYLAVTGVLTGAGNFFRTIGRTRCTTGVGARLTATLRGVCVTG